MYLRERNRNLVRTLVKLTYKQDAPKTGQFKGTWLVHYMGQDYAVKRAMSARELRQLDSFPSNSFDRSRDDVLSEVVAQQRGDVTSDRCAFYTAWAMVGRKFWAVQPALRIPEEGDDCPPEERTAVDEWNRQCMRDSGLSYVGEWNEETEEWDADKDAHYSEVHNVGMLPSGRFVAYDWGFGCRQRAKVERRAGFLIKLDVKARDAYGNPTA